MVKVGSGNGAFPLNVESLHNGAGVEITDYNCVWSEGVDVMLVVEDNVADIPDWPTDFPRSPDPDQFAVGGHDEILPAHGYLGDVDVFVEIVGFLLESLLLVDLQGEVMGNEVEGPLAVEDARQCVVVALRME